MLWYKLADKKNLTISEAMNKIPVSEFSKWIQYYEQEPNDHNTLHWYLAQIAFEVYLLRHVMSSKGQPQRTQIEQFLLKFTVETSKPKSVEPDSWEEEKQRQEAAKMSKAFWFTAVGLEQRGKLKTKLPPNARPKGKSNV